IKRNRLSTFASLSESNSRSVIFHLSKEFLPDNAVIRPIETRIVADSAVVSSGKSNCKEQRRIQKRGIEHVRKIAQGEYVYSKPTMCLHCHLIVEMVHERDADPQKGAWSCPQCGHVYPFQHWKIRKQSPRKAEAA